MDDTGTDGGTDGGTEDGGDGDYSRTNPQLLQIGTLYTGLNRVDDGYHYFIATSQVHSVNVYTTNLVWSLFGNSDFYSDRIKDCWTSEENDTRCTMTDLTVGARYYLYVYTAFSPVDEPNYSVLVE